MGSIQQMSVRNIVGKDFYLATESPDIVADPSTPDAFVEGIMEGKEGYGTTRIKKYGS